MCKHVEKVFRSTGEGNQDKELTVFVNGVEVVSPSNHLIEGKTYVSIEAFGALFYKDFTLNEEEATANFNGETIENMIRLQHG